METVIKVRENAPRQWCIPPLKASDHKYTRGSLLILGGAEMTGASRLAARAAQRVGAGMVTLVVPKACWSVYATSLMSVVVRPYTAKRWQALLADARVRAVLAGPGLGDTPTTREALRCAAASGKTLVLDADALTAMAHNAALRKALGTAPTVLTPHEGEYAQLASALKLTAQSKAARAAALAVRLQSVVVLKGAETLVSDGAEHSVTHPPAWLATAGTGDVLAGIIAGLLAQGMTRLDAAKAGVWLHAQAALVHGRGMIAEDLIDALPGVLRSNA